MRACHAENEQSAHRPRARERAPSVEGLLAQGPRGPGAVIDPILARGLLGDGRRLVAAAHLRREVVYVRVKIRTKQ